MCRCGCFQGECGMGRTQGVHMDLADGGGVGWAVAATVKTCSDGALDVRSFL